MSDIRIVTADEVIAWLHGLPPETIVYEGLNVNYCTVGTYARAVFETEDVTMGAVHIWLREESIRMDHRLQRCVSAWDDANANRENGLTAAEALAVVEGLIA